MPGALQSEWSNSVLQALDNENVFPTPPKNSPPTEEPPKSVTNKSERLPGRFMTTTLQRAQSTPPEITHDHSLRSFTQRPDSDLPDAVRLQNSWRRLHLSKKKSQYYDEAFAQRETSNAAKERVARDSLILAEVKLNCCLESEQEFLIDLSFRLSEIYQRPASCVMVMVATEIAILVSGNSEPAYYMKITALPSEIAATKNKRCAHLVQDFMQESLRIDPRRGVVRFEAVAEEDVATKGMTALQEIEELEMQSNEDEGILRTISRQSRRNRKPIVPIFTDRGKTPTPISRAATPYGQSVHPGELADAKSTVGGTGRKRMKRRMSIMALFKK